MRKVIKNVILNIYLVCFFTGVQASTSIMINVQADTNIIRIGEQFNLTLEANYPENIMVEKPAFDKAIAPGIELIDVLPPDSGKNKNGNLLYKQKYILTSFDTGFHMIPPIPFVVNKGEYTDTLYSNPVPVYVMSVPLDTTGNFYDIKPLYPVKFKASELLEGPFPYIIVGVITALLIFLYLMYWRKKPEEIKKIIQKKKEPAHIIAIRELEILKKDKLWQQNMTKEYYSRLTEIVRRYIENRFNVNALEQTSTEIVGSFIKNRLISETLIEQLKELLSLADLVKFAKGSALPVENEKNMENVYDFIYKTKPETGPVNEANNNKSDVKPEKALKENE